MLLVGKVKNKLKDQTDQQKLAKGLSKLNFIRSEIPAVTHVDNSARIQTVKKENGIYYYLIKNLKRKQVVQLLLIHLLMLEVNHL